MADRFATTVCKHLAERATKACSIEPLLNYDTEWLQGMPLLSTEAFRLSNVQLGEGSEGEVWLGNAAEASVAVKGAPIQFHYLESFCKGSQDFDTEEEASFHNCP